MVEAGTITYKVTRGDWVADVLEFENADGTAHDLSGYDDAIMEFRTGADFTTTLLERLTLGDGLTISGNDLSYTFGEMTHSGKAVYAQLRLVTGTEVRTYLNVIFELKNQIAKI